MSKDIHFQRPPTISESIYLFLKKEIIEGKFLPHQRLQPKEFAKLFNVSSTPVRDAFLRLVSEGYVVMNERKGFVVHEKTPAEVGQLYEIVRALDKAAVKGFMRAPKNKDIKYLKEMTLKLGEYYEEKNAQNYLRQNLKFHEKIWMECGNKLLCETLVQVMGKIAIYRMNIDFTPFSSRAAIEKSFKDHLDIMESLESGDISRLEQIIDHHWGEEFSAEETDSA